MCVGEDVYDNLSVVCNVVEKFLLDLRRWEVMEVVLDNHIVN